MNPPDTNQLWDGIERRNRDSNRRQKENRRSSTERRSDPRDESQKQKLTLRCWMRSLTNARLGVDRRKVPDQRSTIDRRNPSPRSMLTKEEIADLLE